MLLHPAGENWGTVSHKFITANTVGSEVQQSSNKNRKV